MAKENNSYSAVGDHCSYCSSIGNRPDYFPQWKGFFFAGYGWFSHPESAIVYCFHQKT